MTTESEIDAFMAEVRALPKIASADDPFWLAQADGLEWCLRGLHASDDIVAVECFDEVLLLIRDRRVPLKRRLLDLVDKLREWQPRCAPPTRAAPSVAVGHA